MYESKFLEQCSTFEKVCEYVVEQSQKQSLVGPAAVFESLNSPNRSFFYTQLLGAFRLFHDASLLKEEGQSKEEGMANEALTKELRLLRIICCTLFHSGEDFHPRIPNGLRLINQSLAQAQKDHATRRNSSSFKEQQKLEFEAQFLKIRQVLVNDKIRKLFEDAISRGEQVLSTKENIEFKVFSKSICTAQEKIYHAPFNMHLLTKNKASIGQPKLRLSAGTKVPPSFPRESSSVLLPGFYKRQPPQREHSFFSSNLSQPYEMAAINRLINEQRAVKTPQKEDLDRFKTLLTKQEKQSTETDSLCEENHLESSAGNIETLPLSVASRCVPSFNERRLSEREYTCLPSNFWQPNNMASMSSSSNAPQAAVASQEEGSNSVSQSNRNDDSANEFGNKCSFERR